MIDLDVGSTPTLAIFGTIPTESITFDILVSIISNLVYDLLKGVMLMDNKDTSIFVLLGLGLWRAPDDDRQ